MPERSIKDMFEGGKYHPSEKENAGTDEISEPVAMEWESKNEAALREELTKNELYLKNLGFDAQDSRLEGRGPSLQDGVPGKIMARNEEIRKLLGE